MTTTTEVEEINNNYNYIDSGIGGSGGSSSGEQRSSPTTETIKNFSELISPKLNLNNNNNKTLTFSTFGAAVPPFSSSSFSSSSTNNSGMFANVVGYARSRLFKNANEGLLMPGEKDEQQSSFHHSSINLTKQKCLNQQQNCQIAQATPFKKVEEKSLTNEEKNNKIFLNKNNNNKSCPVQRKQFSLSSKLQNEENFSPFSSPLNFKDNWGQKSEFSSSIGSRESVQLIENSSRTNSCLSGDYCKSTKDNNKKEEEHWQLFAVSLHKANQSGFGIAISGSNNNKNQQQSSGIFISDVISNGPAFGLLQIGDKITSCNGYPLEHANYSSAIAVMKEAQQLNMIVKRRVPVPFVEFEQRTLKFTLSKSRKKDDFGIVLGCKFYIKEILNPKLAEKEPGLKEGDSVLRINGQNLDGVSLEEATRLLQRSREKLSLVVQRDVRRSSNGGCANNRWPSQTTVYERLGSVQATPRHSPTPAHYGFPSPQQQQQQNIIVEGQYMSQSGIGRKGSNGTADYSPASGYKRYSDPMSSSLRTDFYQHNNNNNNNVYSYPSQQGGIYSSTPQKQQLQQTTFVLQNNGKPIPTALNETIETNQQKQNNNNYICQSSPYLQHNQHSSLQNPSPHPQHRFLNINNNSVPSILQTRAQSLTPSSVQSLPVVGGGTLNNIINNNSLQRPNFTPPIEQNNNNQQQLIAQQQICSNRYGNSRQINNSIINPLIKQQQQQQTPIIKTISFQKGPSGLGIRVIGGNQVGIFVSAVQEQSHADQHGIRVGDRIHAVNGVSIAGLTREESFDVLLSLGEEQISLAVEHAPEEFAQVKAGKFGDSFYVRSHFAYNRSTSRGASQPGNQQPIELSIRAGDIFHVTDTLFGGSLGYWQATKIYSAEQQNSSSSSESTASCTPATTNTGIIPHSKAAEQLLRIYRQTNNNINNNNLTDQGSNGGTLGRSLFRKKLSLSSRKLFGGGGSNGTTATTIENLDEVLSGAGSVTNSFSEIIPPAYERVALKRPAFHRPIVLYGPLADVARQMLLSQSSMRFGASLPSTSSITSGTGVDPLVSSLSVSPTPERGGSSNILGGIRLCAVDAVMASQKHCVLCVNPSSVERLQLAQYAPIVVLIDVESKTRVRELRAKAGATTQSARKLVEQSQKLKRQYSHLLTATLDATKEDQWFEALRALIFHLQERRVWMPEFQLEQPLDEMLLLPMHPPGDTPTSDGDKSDYGTFDPQQPSLIINGSYYKTNCSGNESRNSPFPQSQPLVLHNIKQANNEINNSINLRQ